MAPKVHLDVRLTDEQNVTNAVTFQRASTLANVGWKKLRRRSAMQSRRIAPQMPLIPIIKPRRRRAL